MEYKYFRDPKNFSYLKDGNSECSICGNKELLFDARMYCGEQDIECICDDCLKAGKLIKLDVSANEVNIDEIMNNATDKESADKKINEIIYMTPKLPSWQELWWPYLNDDFCVFLKIASKQDFIGFKKPEETFINSFSDDVKNQSDLNYVWQHLPDRKITNLKDGNYDMSVYLFKSVDKIHCEWDSN
jgi:uncharacterized protein CbrC (UPF0167 family)